MGDPEAGELLGSSGFTSLNLENRLRTPGLGQTTIEISPKDPPKDHNYLVCYFYNDFYAAYKFKI